MIKPKYLEKGDKIIITSPAGRVTKESVDISAAFLRERGFIVEITENCTSRYFNYAATDELRLKEMQESLDDEEASLILCSRGGYGTGRILSSLNFANFEKNPKWVVGFSDITNLHLHLNNLGIMSVHGPMTQSFTLSEDKESVDNLIKLLIGDTFEYNIRNNELNKTGECEAEIVGGNLSIIYSLQGTKYEINTDNKILFIEDLNEYLYHLDRIMISLKLGGKLSKLKGLVVGGFTDMLDHKNPFGKNAYEIIKEHIVEYDYPVCFDFPAGHISNNQPFTVGETYKLEVKDKTVDFYMKTK